MVHTGAHQQVDDNYGAYLLRCSPPDAESLTYLFVCVWDADAEPDSANMTTTIRFLREGWGVHNRDRISRYGITTDAYVLHLNSVWRATKLSYWLWFGL